MTIQEKLESFTGPDVTKLADLSNVSPATIYNAKAGKRIERTNENAILEGMIKFRELKADASSKI